MKLATLSLCTVLVSSSFSAFAADKVDSIPSTTAQWSPAAARTYLDKREVWWQGWDVSQRDHNTVCISCHSALPYALARPTLRRDLKEDGASAPEQFLLAGVIKRVNLWNEVEPYYPDAKNGAPKTIESRGTESVLNALILSSEDARTGHLSDVTKTAFDAFWSQQLKTGEKAGSWNWLSFHLAPWESSDSQYYGAALGALAVGMAPEHYAATPAIQNDEALLKAYLQRGYEQQPLLNRVAVLWASSKIPDLLTADQRKTLIDSIFLKQQDDGGWTVTTLGTWKRSDDSTLPTTSDGYSTGLIVVALEESGFHSAKLSKAVEWLETSQDKTDGFWPAFSLNKNRDPATDKGKFMTDAATAFSVLALEKSR